MLLYHVTISTSESGDVDERVVYIEDLEKRKQVYGICGECKKPGTGKNWCRPCNAKRFENNFKNWTSGNKIIDEFIQQSQLNAVYYKKCLEWIPFEKFQNIAYIAEGGFGKIYSAEWPEGFIDHWDIKNQKSHRNKWRKYALKSLRNSSNISSDFLNEIKSHLQIHLVDIIQCHGITQDPNTRDYMMILHYCNNGNLRNFLNISKNYINYKSKINKLRQIAGGLLDIHNAGKVHKDFHSGNILYSRATPYISDLGMCQPANKEQTVKEEGIYGVLPFMAPEILRGHQYTKAADIYSFGIMMNEPTTKELYLILTKWDDEIKNIENNYDVYVKNCQNSEIYSQVEECDKIGERKFENRLSKDNHKNIQTHSQAIYTSRLLNFKNLPKTVNSRDLSVIQINSVSECLDVQLSELELNEICQDDESNTE
ncbi:hypothetical protein RclHR1_00360002 [Rhizophagus clarus]|uniref:Protein kinase domain-containing protein n=1 Tax=Rhizophagus clarus TaxID=94130 RepID=A0A2Z6RBY7_9GLOM|nr:hypothetical protein RclHR1_00360002 [Rhizophagus clarus]